MGIPLERSLKFEKFDDLLKNYHDKRSNISKSHLDKCNLLKRELGDYPIKNFANKFEEYIRLLKITPSRRGKLRENSTINRYVEIARAVFRLAVDMEILEKNPISKVRFEKLKEIPRDKYVTNVERKKLLKVIKETPRIKHIEHIVKFAIQVPSRTNELVNLKKENLDLEKNIIVLLNGTTKNDIGCCKPIPPNMIDYFHNIPEKSDYLFYRKVKDEYLSLGDFKHSWRTARKLAKLEEYRFHDLRATSATDLLNNSTDEKVVMLIGNWQTRTMIDRYYRKDVDKMLKGVKFN